jgi:hypothetical protein
VGARLFGNDVLLTGAGLALASAELLLVSAEPLLAGNEPLLTSAEPLLAGCKPLLVSNRPFPVSAEPLLVSNRPFPVSAEPLLAGNRPLLVSAEPLLVGNRPFPVGAGPLLVGNRPLLVGNRPFPVGAGPLPAGKKPLADAFILDAGCALPVVAAGRGFIIYQFSEVYMPHKNKWMPGTKDGKLQMAKTWFAKLAADNPMPGPDGNPQTNAAAWGVPVGMVGDLGALCDKCAAALAKVNDPEANTTAARAECNEKFEELTALMEDLHPYFYLKPFPETALAALGLLPHDKTHTPTPKPTRYVSFEIVVHVEDHRLVFDFWITGSESKSKEPYHGAEFRIWLLPPDAPEPATADAPGWESYASTGTPWQKTFKEDAIGKRLWIAARWENKSTGKSGDADDGKGPWSAFKSVMVP